MRSHPSHVDLETYVLGEADGDTVTVVEYHLHHCRRCRRKCKQLRRDWEDWWGSTDG